MIHVLIEWKLNVEWPYLFVGKKITHEVHRRRVSRFLVIRYCSVWYEKKEEITRKKEYVIGDCSHSTHQTLSCHPFPPPFQSFPYIIISSWMFLFLFVFLFFFFFLSSSTSSLQSKRYISFLFLLLRETLYPPPTFSFCVWKHLFVHSTRHLTIWNISLILFVFSKRSLLTLDQPSISPLQNIIRQRRRFSCHQLSSITFLCMNVSSFSFSPLQHLSHTYPFPLKYIPVTSLGQLVRR